MYRNSYVTVKVHTCSGSVRTRQALSVTSRVVWVAGWLSLCGASRTDKDCVWLPTSCGERSCLAHARNLSPRLTDRPRWVLKGARAAHSSPILMAIRSRPGPIGVMRLWLVNVVSVDCLVCGCGSPRRAEDLPKVGVGLGSENDGTARAVSRRRPAHRGARAAARRGIVPTDLLDVVRHLTLLQLDPTSASRRAPTWCCGAGSARPTTPPSWRTRSTTGRADRAAGVLRPRRGHRAVSRRDGRLAGTGRAARVAGGPPRLGRGQRALPPRHPRPAARGRPAAGTRAARTPASCRGARRWTNNKNVSELLDFMVARGEVAAAGREGRDRLWDLAERVYPDDPAVPVEEARGSATSAGCTRWASPGPSAAESRSSRPTSATPASPPWSRASAASGGSTRR